MKSRLSRRGYLKLSAISGGLVLAGFDGAFWTQLARATEGQVGGDPFRGGKLLGTVEFVHEGMVELGKPIGGELDGRLYSDLSRLGPDNLITPAEQFCIRTRASEVLPDAASWQVKIGGLVERPTSIVVSELPKTVQPRSLGTHVMECAGNVRLTRFALISAGNWTGMPVADFLELAKVKSQASRVLISGFDSYTRESATSVPGASWIFSIDELKAARAFLATQLNGEPLSRDHGAPIRLVVPGWYGCTCIKWVNSITLVDDRAEATSQMLEYAVRTHQKGAPQLAREYEPAIMDQAAMPIRVEKWLAGGTLKYRVVGILWGGSRPVKELEIRFNPEEDYVRVDTVHHMNNDPWTLWSHAWSPKTPGTYSIRLVVKEPQVRTRRLDSGYYTRTVEITEV